MIALGNLGDGADPKKSKSYLDAVKARKLIYTRLGIPCELIEGSSEQTYSLHSNRKSELKS